MGEPMRVLPSPSPSSPASAGRKRRPQSTSALSTFPPASAPAAPSAGASPKLEQLLMDHMRFAQAVKKNDTALLVPFLARDVSIKTLDGARLQGQSAVLAHLVGARMSKLSANLHVKGCPSRTGAAQSSFVYEHGLLFKDPLFIEVLDWRASGTIAAIAHVPLPGAATNKAFQDFLKASDKLRRRAARGASSSSSSFNTRRSVSSDLSDDDSSRSSSASVKPDDEQDSEPDVRTPSQPEEEAASQRDGCRFSCSGKAAAMLEAARSVEAAAAAATPASSAALVVPTRPRQRLSSGDSTGSSSVEASAPASPFDDDAPVFILAELAVLTELTPIRKRKAVNPFVVLHCASTGAVWKSPVRKRQRAPRWTNIPLSFPVRSTSDVLEVELWDQAFLRATKVAATTVLVSQLLKGELAYLASVDMPRAEFADKGTAAAQLDEKPTIQLQLDFRRRLKMDRGSLFETHISSGDEDEREDAADTEQAAELQDGDGDQLAVGSSIGIALCEHMGVSLAVLVTLLAWTLFYFKMYVVQEAAQQ